MDEQRNIIDLTIHTKLEGIHVRVRVFATTCYPDNTDPAGRGLCGLLSFRLEEWKLISQVLRRKSNVLVSYKDEPERNEEHYRFRYQGTLEELAIADRIRDQMEPDERGDE